MRPNKSWTCRERRSGEGEEIPQGVSGGQASSHKGMKARKSLLVGGMERPGQRQGLLGQWSMLSSKVQVYLEGQTCLDLIQPLTGSHGRFLTRDCQARCWQKTRLGSCGGGLRARVPGSCPRAPA